ncbi:MAG: hypothetical protein EOO88_42945, partial [Pedobacter sp.]
MKRIVLAIICLCCIASLNAQSANVRFLIDTTLTLMKGHGVNADTVNWVELRESALRQAKRINDPYQLGPVIRNLYRSIGDFHGAFFYRDSIFNWQLNRPPVSDSIMNEWKKKVKSITYVLDGNIGYLRIPSMPITNPEDFNTLAQELNDSLCNLLAKNIKGLILDLRLDGGGAMHPMILGLEQLLDKGKLGAFHVKGVSDWILTDSAFYVDTSLISSIKPRCNIDARKMPVVMLTSHETASAAECLIIAFKGRPKTVLLGSATAGYVTVNSGMPINDTAYINLAVGYSADRSGKIYRAAIEPDIEMKAVD